MSRQSIAEGLKDLGCIILGLSPFVLTTLSLFLTWPPPWPDEAIFLNTAQTINQTGILATSIFGNAIIGLQQHALWYPPLYFYLLSYWISLFGTSIEALRMLSVILAVASLALFFYLAKLLFHNRKIALAGTLLLATDQAFSQAGRIARMDILSFFFLVATLLSFFLVEKNEKPFFLFPASLQDWRF